LTIIKDYLYRQWTKILSEDVLFQDFVIAKEVKLGKYKYVLIFKLNRNILPPGAMISAKKMQDDNRQEPQYGERVPYLVVHRGLHDRLIDCVVSLDEFFSNK
jgi:DNA polymerase zeta